jgi:hypothetical protein
MIKAEGSLVASVEQTEQTKTQIASRTAAHPRDAEVDPTQDLSQVVGKEDAGCSLEAENTAWDCLRESFETAASQGRYVDLSDEGSNASLSVDAARDEFASLPVPRDPSSMVASSSGSSSSSARDNATAAVSDELLPLARAIARTLVRLGKTREGMVSALGQGEELSSSFLTSVNREVAAVQRQVDKHADSLVSCAKMMANVTDLNRVVYKANILVNEYNSQYEDNWLQEGECSSSPSDSDSESIAAPRDQPPRGSKRQTEASTARSTRPARACRRKKDNGSGAEVHRSWR